MELSKLSAISKLVLFMFLLIALGAASVFAGTVSVTNGNDSGTGSLRQAISNAMAGDTIVFQSGITMVTLTTDQLSINKNLIIDGGSGVTVQRVSAAQFRIFRIESGFTVEMRNLTITGGKAPDGVAGADSSTSSGGNGGNGDYGGGIFLNSNSALTLKNCTVSDNSAGNGGRGGNGGKSDDYAFIGGSGGFGGSGGGIYASGTLTIENCTVKNNIGGSGGNGGNGGLGGSGGIAGGNGGKGGKGNSGGGICASGILKLKNCTVSGNTGGSGGSGGNGGLSRDTTGGDGGDGGDGGGGGIYAFGTSTLENCTVSENSGGNGGNGGNGGWKDGLGGDGGDGGSGGISSNTASIKNIIIAGNKVGDGGIAGSCGSVGDYGDGSDGINGTGPDCSGTIISKDYNLIGSSDGFTFKKLSNDKTDISVPLGSLADNGGPTWTQKPQSITVIPNPPARPTTVKSPATDSGSCYDIAGKQIATDQRGVLRPQNGKCDIGAYELDTTAPSAPGSLALSSASDTGFDTGDRVTYSDPMTITGTGEENATVQLYDGTAPVGTAATVSGGKFSIAVSLSQGAHTLKAKQTDIAKNTSGYSQDLIITADRTAPSGTVTISDNDGYTNLKAPTLKTGSNGDAAYMRFSLESGTVSSCWVPFAAEYSLSAYPPTAGDYHCPVGADTTPFDISQGGDGLKRIYVQFRDTAGNESSIPLQSLDTTTYDSAPPSPPINVSVPSRTNDKTPEWIWESGGGGNGTYSYELRGSSVYTGYVVFPKYVPQTELSDGQYTLFVKERDTAGNWSSWSVSVNATVVIDSSASEPPANLKLAAEDYTGDNITRKTSGLTITGTCEAGATVRLYDNNSEISGITVTVSGTAFSADINLTAGEHSITAVQTDTAGNTSPHSSPLTITVDTACSAPTGLALLPGDDTGMSQTDNWTQKTSGLTVTGFGEEGASVQMYNGDAAIEGSSGLVSSGKFSAIISLPKGTYAIKARQTDPAGNLSAFSEYLNLKVDTTPPKAPKVETSGKNPTSDDTPAWRWASGGEGMGRYRYKLNSSDLNNETEETINTGYTPETSLAEGKHTLYVQECDEAGNWSESGSFEIEVKKAAPDVPKVSGTTPTSDTTPLWTWTSGEAGGTGLFRYKMDDDDLDNGATETAKTSFSPASVLSQGSHTLYVQEKNSADIWSESGSFTIEVDSGKPCSQAASPQAVNPAQNPFIITYTADDVYEGEVCGEAASSGSGLEKAELYVKMHGETEYLLADTDIGNSIDGEFAYTAEKEGMYYFYTRVTDKAGNTENIPEIGYDTMTVYVSEFSGYAIIAVGSVATKDGLKDHTLAANNIYSHLIRRGFALVEEDRETDPLDYIKYFNPSGELQPGEDDYEANKIDYTWALQDALTKWAPEKMKAIPGPLFIILIDHGSPDKFYLTEGQEVTAGTFKIWLDILQNKLDAEGIDQPVIIILGACYSGSFIDDLSDPDRNRIIIASSAENEPSYQGPLDPYSGNRDGEFFTSVLFNGLGAGYDLKTAFEIAVEQTEEHTFSGEEGVPGPWFDGAKQHPLLDDNGDGQGINSFSPGKDGADQKEDGAKSLEIVMGRGESKSLMLTGAGTIPVTPPALDFSVSQATLWAKAADTEDTEVWAEIRKPDMVLKQEGVNQQIVDLKTAKLEWIPEKECYEGVYKSFTDPGKYTIFFYAREKTAGIISPFKKFYLYKADDPNAESPDNDAVSPDDDAISQDDDTVSGADDTGDDTLSPDDDNPSLKTGDADGDGDIDLADAVLALKISCGNDPGDVITAGADANDDGKIGPQEAVYILRKLAGI